MLAMLADIGQAMVSKAEFDAWLKARNAKNKQRAKVRQERGRKGTTAERIYAGEPPQDLQKIFSDICARLTIVGPSGDAQRAVCPCCEDPSPFLIDEAAPPAVKVNAAAKIISLTLKLRDTAEIEDRLRAIEEHLGKQK